MKNQGVVIFVILCFASFKVNANDDVDAIIKQVKSSVKGLELGEDTTKKILCNIEKARKECFSDADDISPDIIKKLAEGTTPALKECGGRVMDVEDPDEKINQIINCLSEKANNFTASSGMTDEEKEKFNDALVCLGKLVNE